MKRIELSGGEVLTAAAIGGGLWAIDGVCGLCCG